MGQSKNHKIIKMINAKMNIERYQQLTQRTLPDLGTYNLNIAHMIFGLNSEMNELYDAKDSVNAGEELSDTAWYISNYANFTGLKLNKIYYFSIQKKNVKWYFTRLFSSKKSLLIKLGAAISKLTDLEKKELAYKKQVDAEKRQVMVKDILIALDNCYQYFNINVLDSLQKNIDKLKARYPEKFTEELANNRNLDLERKILEGK